MKIERQKSSEALKAFRECFRECFRENRSHGMANLLGKIEDNLV